MADRIPESVLGDGPFIKWELTIRDALMLKPLYIRLVDFLLENDWTDLSGGEDFETYYAEIHQGGGVNHSAWWRAKREPKFNGNGYFMFFLHFDIDTFFVSTKEKIIDGQKQNLDNGELRFTCRLFLAKNYYGGDDKQQDEWSKNSVLKFYKKRFWDHENKHFSACKKEITEFSRDFYQFIQTFSGVLPEGEIKDFVPQKGIGN